MPTTPAGLRIQTAALAAAATHVGLATGGDATTPGTEVTGSPYARQAVSWPAADADADWTATAAARVLTPTSATITQWQLWSASTGGTLLAFGRLLDDDGTTPRPASGVSSVDVTPSAATTAA